MRITESLVIENPRKRLVKVLGSIAMYNDKGHQWRGDSAEQIAEEQSKAQGEIERLVTAIGAENLPTELLDALIGGRASQDWSGDFRRFAEQYFLASRK